MKKELETIIAAWIIEYNATVDAYFAEDDYAEQLAYKKKMCTLGAHITEIADIVGIGLNIGNKYINIAE